MVSSVEFSVTVGTDVIGLFPLNNDQLVVDLPSSCPSPQENPGTALITINNCRYLKSISINNNANVGEVTLRFTNDVSIEGSITDILQLLKFYPIRA